MGGRAGGCDGVGVEPEFPPPVKIGDVVCCYATVVSVGRTSIKLDIETWVMRNERSSRLKVTEANFVMVAVDRQGRPRPVDEATNGG